MESGEEALLKKFEALLDAKLSPLVSGMKANAESIERISSLVSGLAKGNEAKPGVSRPRLPKVEDTKSEDGKRTEGPRTPKPPSKGDSEDKPPTKPVRPKTTAADGGSSPDPKRPAAGKRPGKEEGKKEEEHKPEKPAPHSKPVEEPTKPKRTKPAEEHKPEEAKKTAKEPKPGKPGKPAKKKGDDGPPRPTILELLSKKDLKALSEELNHLEKVIIPQHQKKALTNIHPFALSPSSENALILLNCLPESDLFLLDFPEAELVWLFRLMYWLRNQQLPEEDEEAWMEVRKVLVAGHSLGLADALRKMTGEFEFSTEQADVIELQIHDRKDLLQCVEGKELPALFTLVQKLALDGLAYLGLLRDREPAKRFERLSYKKKYIESLKA